MLPSFQHGVHPPESKLTGANPIQRVPFAPSLMIPLSQHIGAPAKAVVRAGQEVVRGERIADAGGFVSVPYHAPVSGEITTVDLVPTAQGKMVEGVYLKPFPGSGQQVAPEKGVSLEATPEEIADAVAASGMTGLGGASFPTHVKYRMPPGRSVDILLVNGAECEPWLTADHRIMLERGESMITGIQYVLRATGADRAVIGVEANKQDAVDHLRSMIPSDLPISVETVAVKYPQGAEKMLMEAVLDRKVPPGKLPLEVGVVVSNAATVAELGQLLPKGEGLVERVLTISGPGVKKRGNYLVPIGTPVRFLLDYVGLEDDATTVLLGGPMMGQALSDTNAPVTKGTSGIVVLTEAETGILKQQAMPCIRCGYCMQACPMFLDPARLGRLAQFHAYEEMRDQFHLWDCFECGSCSFVCPSRIPLVQHFRIAKGALRDAQTKAVV